MLVLQASDGLVSSGDHMTQELRLIDSSGTSSNAGLLQVRTDGSDGFQFGTVCGMNLVGLYLTFAGCSKFSFCLSLLFKAAADVVCSQLGFDYGTISTSACGSYGGSNVCGAAGSPVVMANLNCDGGELGVGDCAFSPPDASCQDHTRDSIVFCGFNGKSESAAEGSLRLISSGGAPSIDGSGRLEIYRNGLWGPVCSSGFTLGSANVACKAMGFAGAKSSTGASRCFKSDGENFCGTVAPLLSEVACAGQEVDLLSCPHDDGDDVFCAPEESVLLTCAGAGNAQGRRKKSVTASVAGAA